MTTKTEPLCIADDEDARIRLVITEHPGWGGVHILIHDGINNVSVGFVVKSQDLHAVAQMFTPTPRTRGSSGGCIEPSPPDRRRLENRVATLESLVQVLSSELPSRIAAIENDLSTWLNTPPQPTAAEGDEAKWEAVASAMAHTSNISPRPVDARGVRFEVHAVKAAVAEAVKQGLAAKPIDPNDERLVHVVTRAVQEDHQGYCACVMWPCAHAWDYMARIALMSIAAAQQEGAK